MPARLLLHIPCTEDHFQPIKGSLRPSFRPNIILRSTKPFPTRTALALPRAALGGWWSKNGMILLLEGNAGVPTLSHLFINGRKSLLVTAGLSPVTLEWGSSDPHSPAHGRVQLWFPLKKHQQEKKERIQFSSKEVSISCPHALQSTPKGDNLAQAP